ncbi:hypothetical protein CKA34_10800 [Rhizobium sp. 11515TR]|nr:hypothetical protein CKA34_10800 [Rhizobium sp. 11515TR]
MVIAIGGLIGTAFVVWRFFKSEVDKVETKVAATTKELADYKTHVAETYISKAGHRETTDQILRAIEGLGGRIDSLFTARRSRGSSE